MRRLKAGDLIRQTLSGYENVDMFMVLDITKETVDEYEAFVFWFGNPPGVYTERIKKEHVENEFITGKYKDASTLRTEIL